MMWRVVVAGVMMAGTGWAGWLSGTQPGFTPDEAVCRIAGDRTNAVALAEATNELWGAMGSHDHDGRYDAAGAAGAVSNGLAGGLAAEAGARAAFDGELQGTNGLTLYGKDLRRETAVDGPAGWLDWRVRDIWAAPTVGTWAHWDNVVLNGDLTVDDDQVADFGESDYGPYAWILDGEGNYRVPQEWHEGDRFANVGPDEAVACWWDGWMWCAGETVVGETPIYAVSTGYGGSDVLGSYDDYGESPVAWRVSEDGKEAWYAIEWEASEGAPWWSPGWVNASALAASIRIRPAAGLAVVWDGGVAGGLYGPEGEALGWLGEGEIEPPVELADGGYFEYWFRESYPWWPGEAGVWLGYDWMYGCEREHEWVQVPSAHEVTNVVAAGIAGDTTRYLKGEVDEIVQGARDDLGAEIEGVATDMAGRVAGSTNLLGPTLAGRFCGEVVEPGTGGVAVLAWGRSPYLAVQNTNAAFLVLPAVPETGVVQSVFFECLGTNALFLTRPVLWASGPPAGRGLYQLYGNAWATNVWRGWAVPETRAPAAYTEFVYGLPPAGVVSNGVFTNPVSVVFGNGATTNGLPETVAVMARADGQVEWTAMPLSRTNLYAGDVGLPFGSLTVAFSNAAEPAVFGAGGFRVTVRYFLESCPDGGRYPMWFPHDTDWGNCKGYPGFSAWYFYKTLPDGSWGGNSSVQIDTLSTPGEAPGFPGRPFRSACFGSGDGAGAIRSPAITGVVSNVRLYGRAYHDPGWHTVLVERCSTAADWTARTNWYAVPGAVVTNLEYQWYSWPVCYTNVYFRLRAYPLVLNAPIFKVAFMEFQ